jgi:hypothetical protein
MRRSDGKALLYGGCSGVKDFGPTLQRDGVLLHGSRLTGRWAPLGYSGMSGMTS